MDGVEYIDEDEKDGDEKSHPTGDHLGGKGTIKKRFHNYLRVDEEGDPADDNEKPAREVVGDNVERHFPRQHQLGK